MTLRREELKDIDYRVPPELAHLILQSDGSILVDRTRGEVAGRCDAEATNVLGLNMVHELVTGKRTVQEARHTSEQNTVAYNAGRDAPYAQRLLFEVPRSGTKDLDEGRLSGSVLQQAVGKLKDALPPGAGRKPATVAPPADSQRRLVRGRWTAGTGGRRSSGRGGKSTGVCLGLYDDPSAGVASAAPTPRPASPPRSLPARPATDLTPGAGALQVGAPWW
jgi:hypothetical protein